MPRSALLIAILVLVMPRPAETQTCRGVVPTLDTWSHFAGWVDLSDSTVQAGGSFLVGNEDVYFGFEAGWFATDESDVDDRPIGVGTFGVRARPASRVEICPSLHASLGLSSGPTRITNEVRIAWLVPPSGNVQIVPTAGLAASYVRRGAAEVTASRPRTDVGGFAEFGLGATMKRFVLVPSVRYLFGFEPGNRWSLGVGIGLIISIAN